MTDAARLLVQYLQQRVERGETRLILSAETAQAIQGVARGNPPVTRPSPPPSQVTQGSAAPTARWRKDAPAIPADGIEIQAPETNLFERNPLADASLTQVIETIATCERCALYEHRTKTVPGEGPSDARLMVVGEGPGANEDASGRPFVGRAGDLLTEILKAIDCPRETVYICNVVKCRPPNNRAPERDEIAACLPYLYRQIELIRPSVILAMGGTAASTLLETRASLGAMRNKVHRFRGIPLIVTYHPAALLRNPNWKKPTWDDVRIARQLLNDG